MCISYRYKNRGCCLSGNGLLSYTGETYDAGNRNEKEVCLAEHLRGAARVRVTGNVHKNGEKQLWDKGEAIPEEIIER